MIWPSSIALGSFGSLNTWTEINESFEETTMPDNNNASMNLVIEVVNKLQEVFFNAGLSLEKFHLPQIAVVGGQSAGKSSVLENFVGRDFLPRGSDIVTRCPLLVQLISNKEEYAMFGHVKGKKYLSFNEVRDEIENRTSALTKGTKKGISQEAIMLRIYSPHVVDLTLVDLPGLTKVPVGDQPQDIGDQTRKLAIKYVSDENTLILAVSPGNNDLANSDALQLAKEVDPEGKRTYGVITKLDLMDEGTDARSILNNLVYPLKRGYIGVVNRSQKDINSKKDIREAQKDEIEFFRNHPAYQDMQNRCGSKYLQELLSKELTEHILKKMPELKESLKKQKDETERQLKNFPSYDGSPLMARRIIHDLILKFSTDSERLINGNGNGIAKQQPSTGAQMLQFFSSEFPTLLTKEYSAFSTEELHLMLANVKGFRYGHFVSEMVCEDCIKKLVETYKNPSNESVEKIGDILKEMVNSLCQEIENFPKLAEQMRDLINEKLAQLELITKEIIRIFIDAQGCFMNTRHPDFRAISSVEEIPLEYYDEIQKHCQNENLTTQIPTFFPSTNLTAKEKNKVIKEFSVVIKNDQNQIGKFQLLVATHYLAVYEKQEKLNKFHGKLNISKLKTEHSENFSVKISTSGKPLSTVGNEITLTFADEKEKLLFCEALQQNNKYQKAEETQPIGVAKNFQEQLEIISYMVDTYMKITEKTIADLLPKLIKNLLVNELLNYFRRDLIINLDENQQELLEISPDEIRRKKELQNIFTATEKALKTLDNLSYNFRKIKSTNDTKET